MKYIIILVSLFYLSTLSAQDNNMLTNFTNGTVLVNAPAAFGVTLHVKNPLRKVEGTVYLFDDFENRGIIYTNDNQRLLIRNINLNLKYHTFESKISGDSLFTFNFNNIEKFVINNRVFKNFYWDNDNRVYEVIAESKNLEILKGFNVKFVEGSSNPMLNRANDKYVRSEKYYVRKNDKISFLVLKKSRILKLLDLNEKQREKLLQYVQQNGLSFKNEEDIKKISQYGESIKS